MGNLIFSLNATMPVFLLMILGFVFRKAGLFDDNFVNKANQFVFKVALPVMVFKDLAEEDFYQAWDGKFVLFCFLATTCTILLSVFLSGFFVGKNLRGEFVQASYRSSAALLGIAFIQNIYGDSGMAPLMIIGTVPLYNAMAVAVLTLMNSKNASVPDGLQGENGVSGQKKQAKLDPALLTKTAKGIITNPIILGIAAGLLWSLLRLPMPVILQKTAGNIGGLATPLGLMAMGASFEWKKAFAMIRPALVCSALKLVGFAAVLVPLAALLGFRNEALVAVLVMAGSATTVSCYVMARNMGHEGVLTSSVVMMTTFCSAFTLTGWLFLLRSLALI